MAQTLTTMLTVVTALGAIWAALVSTRQAQASSVLARVAQQGLEEQIRSFRQQNELAREQNERARREEERSRISFEVDMLFKLADRFNSPIFLTTRRRAAKFMKEHYLTDDGELLEVEHINRDMVGVINFFEELGHLVKMEVLQSESVWHRFGAR